MLSRKLHDESLDASNKADGRWAGPNGSVLVEVKRTNSVRDVRDALLALVYPLRDEPLTTEAVCVLTDSKLSHNRLAAELQMFRSVIHPDLAGRVHLLYSTPNGSFRGSYKHASPDFFKWLLNLIEVETSTGHRPGRATVIAALAQILLWGAEPVTLKRLQELCGVSYPTVAAALKELEGRGLLEQSSERGVRLKDLTTEQWMQLARDHAAKRKAIAFVDPTGQTTPDALTRRLWKLQQQGKVPDGVRVGGVLGASFHFPDLDITAAPRLDLSVDGHSLDFVQKIDAALVPQAEPRQKPAVMVHLTRDPWVVYEELEERRRWASELECLADLVEMGLNREAAEMANNFTFMAKQRKGGRSIGATFTS